jgi:hypothetical protein
VSDYDWSGNLTLEIEVGMFYDVNQFVILENQPDYDIARLNDLIPELETVGTTNCYVRKVSLLPHPGLVVYDGGNYSSLGSRHDTMGTN